MIRAYDEIPDGMKKLDSLPPLPMIIASNRFPAYLRLVAAEIHTKPYSTVGSVLSSMSKEDIMSVLEGWNYIIEGVKDQVRDQVEPDESGRVTLTLGGAGTQFISFVMLCVMTAQSETGEAKFDPTTLGLQVDLMSTFMKAVIVAGVFEDVYLDVTSFSLTPDFLNKNFDSIFHSQNFKALKYVKEILTHWRELKKSETYSDLQGKPGTKKDDEVQGKKRGYNSDSLLKALGKTGSDVKDKAEAGPEATPNQSSSKLASLEEKLRRRLGGG